MPPIKFRRISLYLASAIVLVLFGFDLREITHRYGRCGNLPPKSSRNGVIYGATNRLLAVNLPIGVEAMDMTHGVTLTVKLVPRLAEGETGDDDEGRPIPELQEIILQEHFFDHAAAPGVNSFRIMLEVIKNEYPMAGIWPKTSGMVRVREASTPVVLINCDIIQPSHTTYLGLPVVDVSGGVIFERTALEFKKSSYASVIRSLSPHSRDQRTKHICVSTFGTLSVDGDVPDYDLVFVQKSGKQLSP